METIPTLILTARSDCIVLLGTCGHQLDAGGRLVFPAPFDGEIVFTAWGIRDGCELIPIPMLARIRFSNGSVIGSTLSVVDWGFAAEAEISLPTIPRDRCDMPLLLDSKEIPFGGKTAKAELYRDGVIRLGISGRGMDPVTLAIGEGRSGSLGVLDVGSERLINISISSGYGERLILLNGEAETLLDISGDTAEVIDGLPTAITGLDTVRGHEKKQSFEFAGGSFRSPKEEIGFFTHSPHEPEDDRERALSVIEEAHIGIDEEWMRFVDPELAKELTGGALRDFLGLFDKAKLAPVTEPAGRVTVGLIDNGLLISRPRLLSCVMSGGMLTDIEEG